MPSVFKWSDALTFGLAALVVTAISIKAALTPQGPDFKAVGYVIMWITAAGFWLLYGLALLGRWKFRESIAYVTKQGVLVKFADGLRSSALPIGTLELEIERVLDAWVETGWHDTRDALKGTLVVWKPMPFESDFRPGWFAGLAWPSKKTCWVGFSLPLQNSALGHELGHVLLWAWKHDDSEAGLHDAAGKYGIPY